MFFLVFMKKYKELEKSTRGLLDPLKIVLENETSLNRARRKRAWKCPWDQWKSTVYCTVLYCTVQLYCTVPCCGPSPTAATPRQSWWLTWRPRSSQHRDCMGTHTLHRYIVPEEIYYSNVVDRARLRTTSTTLTSTALSMRSSVGSGTVWTVQDMSKNPIVTCARILKTDERLIL